jgi:ribosomal peptide maturation radical SAM protein 1
MASKVLLLSMPYGALDRPALGLSLLKAGLQRHGIACDLRYLTFSFAEWIGYDDYQWLSSELPHVAFVGDWTFTQSLHGDRAQEEARYLDGVLRSIWNMDEQALRRILGVRERIGHFLDYCMQLIPWEQYAIVGFTSTFEQNIASLALARRLKEAFPRMAIVFGGANWEGEMGLELHRRFPFVDYSCSGEADESFPALVKELLKKQTSPRALHSVRGIVFRKGAESISTGASQPVQDMDGLPLPDYSDYFDQLAHSTVSAFVLPRLLIETSRGCWWGAKSHCTFCGLNGASMGFRAKSPKQALQELYQLVDRWQIRSVMAVDNILDMKYFGTLLTELAAADLKLDLFYEVKANLKRHHVKLLSEAGVRRIQPGIESLSDHVLKLMRKGSTALQNIQLLKWCAEYGVHADWNLLHGFPGETREDYAAMLRLFPAIQFLIPPGACGPIRLDRFSPYFMTPQAFGLKNLRPLPPYRYLYPFEEASLSRIAYYFDFDYEPKVDPTGYAAHAVAAANAWRRTPEPGVLQALQRADGTLALRDSRPSASYPELILSGPEQLIYAYCDELRSVSGILEHLREQCPRAEFDEPSLLRFLESLVANRLMVTDGKHYLSLALGVAPVVPETAGRVVRGALEPFKQEMARV